MRVTLVIPPSGFLMDERVFPSLGVLKVAASLESAGVEVDVLDLSGVDDYVGAARRHVADFGADRAAYGITATMPQMPAAARIAQQVRFYSDARAILGGPHVTLLNSSAKAEAARGGPGRATRAVDELRGLFDVLVCGDGERAVGIALAPDPPALVDADDPSSTLFLTRGDLDDASFPARHLIDLKSYRYEIDGHRTHSLIAQLGCPFGCNFCGGRRSPFLRRVRLRSTGNVVAEVRHLHERWGATGFMFLDDELNVNTQFIGLLDALRDLQSDLGVDFRFRGLLKSQLVTDAMARAMWDTGFRQVLIGFESGAERILLNMNKAATRDENTRCVEIVKAAGLQVKALMSLGHPGETFDTIEATRDWLLQVEPDDFDVTIITVYPGTPYYEDARELTPGVWTYVDPKNGDRLHQLPVDHLRDENFYKGAPGAYRSFVFTDDVSADALCSFRDHVERDVREKLGIPWPTTAAARQYEHSMGLR